MSEPTWSLDGAAIARTTALGAVWTVKSVTVSSAVVASRDHKYIAVHDALVDQGTAHLEPARTVEIVVDADVSGLFGSDVDAKLADGWGELVSAFNPEALGVVKLQSSRLDRNGATITRYLLVEVIGVPTLDVRTAKPGGNDESGAYHGHDGYIVYRIVCRTLFPYWIGSALLTLDTAPAAAELDIGASPDTVTISNPGDRWVGQRFVVKAGSVSGTVTEIQIDNAANDDELVWRNAGGFIAGDYLDWFATDPRAKDFSSPANARGKSRLNTGSNTLTGTRGAGSGTLTLQLSRPELYLTN